MFKEASKAKIEFILKMTNNIKIILERHNGITKALSDEVEARPAILMALMQIGESLKKIDNNILEKFDLIKDVKGAYDVKNFIAHDYEGVNMVTIENILRVHIPILENKFLLLLKEFEKLKMECKKDKNATKINLKEE